MLENVGELYVDIYLCIRQYIFCVLDALYIINLYLILLQIFNKCHTKLFNIFVYFLFSPTFPRFWLKPTGKTVKPLADFGLSNFRISAKTTTVKDKTDRLLSQTGQLAGIISFRPVLPIFDKTCPLSVTRYCDPCPQPLWSAFIFNYLYQHTLSS
jgi:hypothetical protein